MKRFQRMIKLQFGLLLLVNLSVFASGDKEFPQENVKLTGKYYAYPVGLNGSPYLQEEWQQGNLNLENGKTAFNVKIRLNIIDNDLTFYNEALKRVFVADKETVRSFVINSGRNDSLLFLKYTGEGVGFKLKKDDFVHILCQGKVVLMVKHLADVIDESNASSRDKVYPKNFYFATTSNQTTEIKLSYRSVYNLFPSKKKEIKRLISENKLRKSTEVNFIRLINLINNTPGF